MKKIFLLLLASLLGVILCAGIVLADSVPCKTFHGQTCYSTKAEAVSHVPAYIEPKDCFVWDDNWKDQDHRWRVIPGYGCAHWVAHQLNIKHGKGCYEGYSIRIEDITKKSGRKKITDIRCCKVGDVWTTNNGKHSGIVRNVGTNDGKPAVEVESCSSNYDGGVGREWRDSGICWSDGSCEGTTCGANAHCSANCKCRCDDGYKDCDGNWSNGCECPPDQWCKKDECVPEASTLVVVAVGLLFLAGYVRLLRRKKK